MRAIISSHISIPATCSPALITRLRAELSFANPEYAKRAKLGLWLGGTNKTVEGIRRTPGHYLLPRGALSLLERACHSYGIWLEIEDRRMRYNLIPTIDVGCLRYYQERAVLALVTGGQGLLVAPCGSGKTTIALSAAARVGQPTLIMVHTRDLLEQWRERIQSQLAVEAGVVSEGKSSPARFTVATVQTLANYLPDALRALYTAFGCVILDECHHAPARTFWRLLACAPACYRWGLSATPERDDGLTPLLGWAFGPRLATIDRAELLAAGHLEQPTIREVETSFRYDWQGPRDWNKCIAALIEDPDRNRLLTETIAREAQAGHSVLVLSGRVEHCEILVRLLAELGVTASVLVGKIKKRDRASTLAGFRDGSIRVVVASTIADEGLDVPRIDRLVLATPSKAQGRTVQRVGRIMRPSPGKPAPVVIDLVDRHVPPLRWQARSRARAYAEALGGAA